MTGTITNLTTGEQRIYASVKERRLIIRAWDRQGCAGVQVVPNVRTVSLFTRAERTMLWRKKNQQRTRYIAKKGYNKKHGKPFDISYQQFLKRNL